jgi:diacylglycerol kinase (ATP)
LYYLTIKPNPMKKPENERLFFVINPNSGSKSHDWETIINDYFVHLDYQIELYFLTKNCNHDTIKERIDTFKPTKAVAIGGDGTVKLVAECIIKTSIILGILPGGSANGLARELGISEDPVEALDALVHGMIRKIHTTTVNDQLCIHLSDVGLNAYLMKKFESNGVRGMWGYMIASIKVLLQNTPMDIEMLIGGEKIKMKAFMVVIANATKYGTGAVINPIGNLDDEYFEVIVIKQISFLEVFKMVVSHQSYDKEKTMVYQTNSLTMKSKKKVHFQIDGEYLGKINAVDASLVADALRVIVPQG